VRNAKLLIFLAAVAIAGIFLGNVYMSATSPSSVKVMVHKVELMTEAADTDPQVVFLSSTGQEIDFTKDVDAVAGQAQIPAGTYKRVRMTVTNGIKLSIADTADNPCGGAVFTDRVFPIIEGTDLGSKVQINFATYDDNGGTWSGPQIVHLLLRPITINENRTTQVKFKFNTDDTLFCADDIVQRRAPWSVWATTL
jgi:hypothetical protein